MQEVVRHLFRDAEILGIEPRNGDQSSRRQPLTMMIIPMKLPLQSGTISTCQHIPSLQLISHVRSLTF